MAWLYATPRSSDPKRPNSESRYQKFRRIADSGRDAPHLEMPEIEGGAYLIEYLAEIGEAKHGSTGIVPIEWIDIKAWQDVTGMVLNMWEAKTIKYLSAVYVNQYIEAGDPNCPPPWMSRAPDANQINAKLDTMMNLLSAKK